MKQLDELIAKLGSLYIPIYVKGKEYPGNNPYILNKINNMLDAGRIKRRYGDLTEPVETLEPDDLQFDGKLIRWFDENKDFVVYDDLRKVNSLMIDEMNRLSRENNERLAAEEGTSN